MDNDSRINNILEFWFANLTVHGVCQPQQQQLWFKSSSETDAIIEAHYASEVEQALAGELDTWAGSNRGVIALILLLDQFTRNIYRNTPKAFAGDTRALQLAEDTVNTGRDLQMPAIHRVFLYIPFEHSEDLAMQEKGISCFERLLEDSPEEIREEIAGFQSYMVAHRDVIARFGRFPHRNRILGRESSQEELEHLASHGGF